MFTLQIRLYHVSVIRMSIQGGRGVHVYNTDITISCFCDKDVNKGGSYSVCLLLSTFGNKKTQ